VVRNATASLLWAACRPTLDPAAVDAALDAGADVSRAGELSVAQRVSPLLVRALDGRDVPRAAAADAARVRAQSRLVLPSVGQLALAPLASAGLTPLVIKGAALVDRYGPGLRPMDDVDLLVPRPLFADTIETLLDAGWTRPPTKNRNTHEVTLAHPSLPGMSVDAHQEWSRWTNRSDGLTVDTLWSERTERTVLGTPAFVVPAEVELVMLAAHAAKPYHQFDRLLWTVDIAVVASTTAVDWDRVERFATEHRCRVAVAVALTQATHLGLESPPELRAPVDQRHAALLDHDWPTTERTNDLRAQLRYSLTDSRWTAARLLGGDVFNQGVVQAPRRVVRMARRYTRTRLSKSSRQPA
jgi:hypothetical protein